MHLQSPFWPNLAKILHLILILATFLIAALNSSSATSALDPRDACFGLYADKQKLADASVYAVYKVDSEAECSDKCRRHYKENYQCHFYSYGRSDESCHLSLAHRHNVSLELDANFDVFERLNYCLEGHRGFVAQRPRDDKAFDNEDNVGPDEAEDNAEPDEAEAKVDRPEALAQLVHSGVCFRLALSSRRLADSLILESHTAFDLEQCMDACVDETDFKCKAFAFRRPSGGAERLNCDLTDNDTSVLDKYSSHHFYESAVTDVYEIDPSAKICDPVAPLHTILEEGDDELQLQQNQQDHQHRVQGTRRDCYGRIRTGFKHYLYRDHRNVFSASHCSDKCRALAFCQTFSFRYGPIRPDESGNCLISDKMATELTDADLEISDEKSGDWDVFELRRSAICDQQNNNLGGLDEGLKDENLNDEGLISDGGPECRALIRRRATLKSRLVSARVGAATLRLCTNACFLDPSCHVFSFSSRTGRCALARVRALASDDLEPEEDADVFELLRSDCKPSIEAIEEEEDDIYFDNNNNFDNGLKQCHRRSRVGFRHVSEVVSEQLELETLALCSEQCRRSSRCNSFSFRYQRSIGRGQSTCLLSESRVDEALQRGVVRPDSDWDLYQSFDNCENEDEIDDDINDDDAKNDCYTLVRLGLKHRVQTASHSLQVPDLHECFLRCRRQVLPPCNSFSFEKAKGNKKGNTRGNIGSNKNAINANCLISPLRPIEALDTRDLSFDTGWSVYEHRRRADCDRVQHRRPANKGQCYRRVRSRTRLRSSSSTQFATSVATCATLCRRRDFCRMFAFDSVRNECQLSNLDDLDLVSSPDFDLYELNEDCDNSEGGANNENLCFRLEKRGYRHQGSIVQAFLRMRDERSCAEECRAAPFCHSFSYRSRAGPNDDNCLLTSLVFDVNADFQLVQSLEWDLFSIDLDCRKETTIDMNECVRRDRSGFRFDATAITSELRVSSLNLCSKACHQQSTCKALAFKRSTRGEVDGVRCQLSSLPVTSLFGRDLEEDKDWDIYEKLFVDDPDKCKRGQIGDGEQDGKCYSRLHSRRRHSQIAVMDAFRTDNLNICARECGRIPRCRSFSFTADASSIDNCLISFEENNFGLDLNSHWNVYSFNYLRPECRTQDATTSAMLPTNLPCLRLIESDVRLRPDRALATISTDRLHLCHRACRTNPLCHSFSFSEQSISDSCILSSMRFEEKDRQFFEHHPRSKVYQLRFGSTCDTTSTTGQPGPPLPHIPSYPEPDCYQILASGKCPRSPSRVVTTFTLTECSSICSASPSCHLLAFSSARLSDNCLLSDDIKGELVPSVEFDVYQRRHAQECLHNIGPPPPLYDETLRTRCHERAYKEKRLRAALVATRVRELRECEQLCIRATTIRCTGFAFRNNRLGPEDLHESNCELTDASVNRLPHSVTFDPGWSIFVRSGFTGVCGSSDLDQDVVGLSHLECYEPHSSGFSLSAELIVEQSIASSVAACARNCDNLSRRSRRGCRTFVFTSASICLLSDIGKEEVHRSRIYDPRSEIYTRRPSCHQDLVASPSWSVSGRVCRNSPRLESRARYWYCETQDDPVGWDYCCRPGHNCDSTSHDEYPWCFVGEQGLDQWRPCQPLWGNSNNKYQEKYPDNSDFKGEYKDEYGAPPKKEYGAPPKYKAEYGAPYSAPLTALPLVRKAAKPAEEHMAPDRETQLSPIADSENKEDVAILKFG